MLAAPSGDKTPPQRNKTGAGGKDVSFEASNNQQGHACGVEPWRAARPLRSDALLRSLVTLPPLRQIGMGAAMVATLETEARARNCQAIYLLTASDAKF